MRILALEPYYGGSHKAFLDGWIKHSRHEWTVIGLPAYKWKWRMRHSAVTFAEEISGRMSMGESWDLIFCADMVDVAGLVGLLPAAAQSLPRVVYFHENQLTYPVQNEDERDYTYAFTNMTSALAATSVWFNSRFHQDEFLSALARLLNKMPDYQPLASVEKIRDKSLVQCLGIDAIESSNAWKDGPLRVVWAARWEYDKNPEDFFAALRIIRSKEIEFRLSVIGESFRNSPPIFEQARAEFALQIDHWGFQESRADYLAVLQWADVAVSTAVHEFFGLGMLEAAASGCYPLMPNRLSYPEVFDKRANPEFFYGESPASLANALKRVSEMKTSGSHVDGSAFSMARKYAWATRADEMDHGLEKIEVIRP